MLARRRRKALYRDEQEILAATFLSLCGAVLAGLILEMNKETLASVAGVFLILPGVFDLGGSVAGALGAKLSHGYKAHANKIRVFFLHSLAYSLGVMTVAAVILGVFGAGIGALIFDADFGEVFKITVIACLICAVVGLPLVGSFALSLHKRGVDADNIIGPIETSFFDSFSVVTLIIAIWLVT